MLSDYHLYVGITEFSGGGCGITGKSFGDSFYCPAAATTATAWDADAATAVWSSYSGVAGTSVGFLNSS